MNDQTRIASGWVVDVTRWRMAQLRLWQEAQACGDITIMNELMSDVIQEWTFGGDPTDDLDYDDLSAEEWSECVAQVERTISAFVEGRSMGKSNGRLSSPQSLMPTPRSA